MNDLLCLQNMIKEFKSEYMCIISLIKKREKTALKKIKIKITKLQKLNEILKQAFTKIKEKSELYIKYKKEKEINNKYISQEIKINNILSTAIKKISKDIPFFNISTNTTKYNISSILPIDFINLTLRLDKQDSYPIDLQNSNAVPYSYLRPYPSGDRELINSILKFNLSDETRLKPPIIEPNEQKVPRGQLVKFSYPNFNFNFNNNTQNSNPVFFKYFMYKDEQNMNEIPSFFTGILYNENCPISIQDDCCIKVCSCKIGFKDSIILTQHYTISSEINNQNITEIELINRNSNPGVVDRPKNEMVGNQIYQQIQIDPNLSPNSNSVSYYQPSYRKNSFSDGSDNILDDDIL